LSPAPSLRVGVVAGEASGDTLGAALIAALRARVPDVQVFGMAGPRMVAAGCEAWESSDQLGVMGLFEVLSHLPRLLALRRTLVARFAQAQPDVFVGIDVPDFNLGIEKRLKAKGLRTVQYVSPQVWAWRQGRVRTIGQSCDLVLCLLPFETEFYARHGVRAEFVGHPLADQIPLDVDREGARRALGLDSTATVVALLPGSRLGEVQRLAADFISAAAWMAARKHGMRFVAPMASRRVRDAFERHLAGAQAPAIDVLDGQAQRALAAADGVIVASGTATLETLLSGRPMVVAYRLGALTAFMLKQLGLVKVPYFSQPNLLLGRRRVPEFFQDQVTGAALGEALLAQMADSGEVATLQSEFRSVHELLRRGGAARAADAILEYVGVEPVAPTPDAPLRSDSVDGAESALSKRGGEHGDPGDPKDRNLRGAAGERGQDDRNSRGAHDATDPTRKIPRP
jgi:lipid-A-disaccharide synthase